VHITIISKFCGVFGVKIMIRYLLLSKYCNDFGDTVNAVNL